MITEYRINSWKRETKELISELTYIKVVALLESCLLESSSEQWEKKDWIKEEIITKNIPIPKKKGIYRNLIDANLNIMDVARIYKLSIVNDKINCPYHNDEDPSCKLFKESNTFFCFGCGAKGDIIELIRKLEEIIYGNKT